MAPEDLLCLSHLAYQDCFNDNKMKDKTIAEVIEETRLDHTDKETGIVDPEWDSFCNYVNSRTELAGMTVHNVEHNDVDGGDMITFCDPESRQAVIVYEGTCSGAGWKEDFYTGYKPHTDSQERALEYAQHRRDELRKDGYYIYSTGHSKGGNEAALAAVEEDLDCAFCFDAPGNPVSYYEDETLAKRARDNAYKITYFSNENCPVSPMNIRYASEEHWYKTAGTEEWNEWDYGKLSDIKGILKFSPGAHASKFLFYDASYTMEEVDGPAEHNKTIHDLTMFIETELPKEDAEYLLDGIGEVVMAARDGKQGKAWLEGLDPKFVALVVATLVEYPESAEFFESLLDDEWLKNTAAAAGKIGIEKYSEYGPLFMIVASVSPKMAAFLLKVLGKAATWYLKGVKAMVTVYRAKFRAHKLIVEAKRKLHETRMATFHVHDFSDDALQNLERIANDYKNTPIRSLFDNWKQTYGDKPFFVKWIFMGLSFLTVVTDTVIQLLDNAMDRGMDKVRTCFTKAKTIDSQCEGRVIQSHHALRWATNTLRQLM